MATQKTVRIDVLPESAWRYSGYDAIVCVDVLLSATTLLTALAQGRRVRVAESPAGGAEAGVDLDKPLLLTDALSGAPMTARSGLPFGGPASLDADGGRQPIVHVSPFSRMLAAAARRTRVYVACLRNLEATANELALQHQRVVAIGAGQDGEVCAADQMGTAWLALRLQGRHFDLEGRHTTDEVKRWGSSEVSLIGLSRSAERLRGRGQGAEVEFVLRHVNDLDVVGEYRGGEIEDTAAQRRKLEQEAPTPAWGTHAVPVTERR